LNIQKKVSLVLYRQMDDNASVFSIERLIDSIIKRSKDTPASCHPSAEVDLSKEGADGAVFNLGAQVILPLSVSAPLAGQIGYFLRQFFHGVSRKYLQLYVVAFCCYRPESRWEKRTILRACLQHPPIRYGELLEFSSPNLLKVEGF
jgi:hypothetical protein